MCVASRQGTRAGSLLIKPPEGCSQKQWGQGRVKGYASGPCGDWAHCHTGNRWRLAVCCLFSPQHHPGAWLWHLAVEREPCCGLLGLASWPDQLCLITGCQLPLLTQGANKGVVGPGSPWGFSTCAAVFGAGAGCLCKTHPCTHLVHISCKHLKLCQSCLEHPSLRKTTKIEENVYTEGHITGTLSKLMVQACMGLWAAAWKWGN